MVLALGLRARPHAARLGASAAVAP